MLRRTQKMFRICPDGDHEEEDEAGGESIYKTPFTPTAGMNSELSPSTDRDNGQEIVGLAPDSSKRFSQINFWEDPLDINCVNKPFYVTALKYIKHPQLTPHKISHLIKMGYDLKTQLMFFIENTYPTTDCESGPGLSKLRSLFERRIRICRLVKIQIEEDIVEINCTMRRFLPIIVRQATPTEAKLVEEFLSRDDGSFYSLFAELYALESLEADCYSGQGLEHEEDFVKLRLDHVLLKFERAKHSLEEKCETILGIAARHIRSNDMEKFIYCVNYKYRAIHYFHGIMDTIDMYENFVSHIQEIGDK